jgi:ubiquinone/menaquinone biosynthesis C-methylase UbiE
MASTSTTQSVYGQTYGGSAPENYERYFVPVIGGPFATDLVADASLSPGERVLDVACGTGVVARLAAERVGPSGSVAGLDINPGMLAVARAIAGDARAPIRWYETAAESMPLPDQSFDVVFCQLGLMFMADKPAAVRHMRRVLAPGGRVFATTPVPNPFFDVLDRAVARQISEEAAGFVRAVFSLHDPSVLTTLLDEAGFSGVSVRTHTRTVRLPPAADFVWQYVNCTPLAALLSGVTRDQAAGLERDAVSGWQPWSEKDGMAYDQSVLVATGRVAV